MAADRSGATERHVDLVKLDFYARREELQERIPESDPRASHAGYEGTYARYSEPHTMEECPWPE